MLKKEIIANVFMIVLGTLMHFAYQLSNQNPIVGMFVPINESVWEHLKLLFFPGLFYFLGETFFQKEKLPHQWIAFIFSQFKGLIFIPTSFYTYTGIIGKHFLIIDIVIFVLAVFLSNRLKYRLLKEKRDYPRWTNPFVVMAVLVLIGLFWGFTFFPPALPFFSP
ncbi:MAG: DUF6512 family protein [Bacilli bacterium]|jgi:hypothetical protein|nr:DUF6512 family protein [Bacilli bacterium]HHU23512.1 hypothetical protein [Acholeplasmataceae bacterium]